MVEEINVIHIGDMSPEVKSYVLKKVEQKSNAFKVNFVGYAEIKMVADTSLIKVDSIEPIEGTDIDWIKQNNINSDIDMSNIF